MPTDTSYTDILARPGSVSYKESPALRRGMRMPGRVKGLIALFGVVAFIIALIAGLKINSAVTSAPARYAESIQNSISSAKQELPTLASYVGSDNDAIRSALSSAGVSVIDVDAMYADEDELDPNSLDLVKVPHDMPYDKAVELFGGSLRRASVTEAMYYLASTWRLSSQTSSGSDLKVKYADFQSETIEDAIASAMATQGWSNSSMGDSGVDESGNKFQNGTIAINDKTYRWSVSACPLGDVYNVSGLPNNSFYVGARLYQ